MSDSNFGAVTRFQGFVDLFDAAWEADCLSDDDIVLPEEYELPQDDLDFEDDAEKGGGGGQVETWNDLALETLG